MPVDVRSDGPLIKFAESSGGCSGVDKKRVKIEGEKHLWRDRHVFAEEAAVWQIMEARGKERERRGKKRREGMEMYLCCLSNCDLQGIPF